MTKMLELKDTAKVLSDTDFSLASFLFKNYIKTLAYKEFENKNITL